MHFLIRSASLNTLVDDLVLYILGSLCVTSYRSLYTVISPQHQHHVFRIQALC
uniref:Uncharacterized protein n=1 Tax=Anguilla anguilla TaxID=7936 RepID=A0A0E9SHV4_ANGAN